MIKSRSVEYGRPRRRHVARAVASIAAVLMTAASLAIPAAADGQMPIPPGGEEGTVGASEQPEWAGDTPNTTGGTDYYVDATGGDDDASGTSPSEAWQTLARVNATTFSPGDRILLKAGEEWHNEQLWPKGSGESGRPIVIDAYGEPGERRPYIATNGNVPSPFTSGTTKNPETVGLTGALVLRNQQFFEIGNLELSNDDDFGTDITSATPGVVRDGVAISINADLFDESEEDRIMEYFRISDLYVHDIDGPSSWQQIHYGGINFQVFGQNRFSEYEESAYYFKDVRIENNTFDKVELHAIQLAFNWFFDRDAESGQYDESGKWHAGWEQLWVRTRDLYSRDVYVGHNYAYDTGQGAIQLANVKDMVVEYNEINKYLQRYNNVSVALYLWAGADSVMQFNEVYGGPWHEFDGTPWDLEYTNFDVGYQYNYSHDNAAGWMSYMGNSSDSYARYNLSVNDNGVLVKNMLSSNYSPTYFMNNVFVYDAEHMDWFHDERFLDTVYFMNNVFYNMSETTTTPWFRRSGALDLAEFSNNAFYEASGAYSAQQPADDDAVIGDPMFVADVADYKVDNGVLNIRDSAANFKLDPGSPLIDAGRDNRHIGSADFFGTDLHLGSAPDIGIHESSYCEDSMGDCGSGESVNLALDQPTTATSTNPHQNFALSADKLVDGDRTTRWAAADDADLPIVIEIDFGEATTFDEIFLDEYTDSGTDPRVQSYELQMLDPGTDDWVTFAEENGGMGHDVTIADFGAVTSTGLRLVLNSVSPDQQLMPTMTEIQVYSAG